MPLTDPEPDSAEDIFNEALQFLGEDAVKDDSTISYGPLTLTVALKVREIPIVSLYKTHSYIGGQSAHLSCSACAE